MKLFAPNRTLRNAAIEQPTFIAKVPSDLLRRTISFAGNPATDILKLFRVSRWFNHCVDSKEAWEESTIRIDDSNITFKRLFQFNAGNNRSNVSLLLTQIVLPSQASLLSTQ